MKVPTQPTHVIGICGGAVAGSEAARLFAERGAIAIVYEQNARPYGKIEDGLPRWHEKLREKEYGRIDENLSTPGVLFVPETRIGRDTSISELTDHLGLSAVILATGAWRDRPLPIEGIERFVGRGLVYQNAFVHWFNHQDEPDHRGPRFDVHQGAIVVGGGLASIDVTKILQLEAYSAALARRGIGADVVEMEHAGIPATLARHGVDVTELGVESCTLFYRRRIADMPLASAKNPTPEQQTKLEATRVRIVDKIREKYLVRARECCVPVGPVAEGDRLVGLVFRETRMMGDGLREVSGSDFEVRSPLVVSSIGSLPEPISGVPTRGDLFHFESVATGGVTGMPGVWGLGNVLTGKGNIRDSRVNASVVAERIIETLAGVPEHADTVDDMSDALHEEFLARAAPLVDRALAGDKLEPERIARVLDHVRARWGETGYGGDYATWIAAHRPDAGPGVRHD